MTIEQLRAAVAWITACLRQIHDDALARGAEITDAAERAAATALTEDEQTRWDEGTAEVQRLRGLIDRHNEVARLAALPEHVELPDPAPAPQTRTRSDRDLYDLSAVHYGDAGAVRDRALAVIERADIGGVEDRHREQAELLVRSLGESLAARVVLTSSPEYRRGFLKAAGGRAELMTTDERTAMERAISLGGTAGYAVPAMLDPTIIDTGSHSTNPFRQISTIKRITGTKWTGVSSAGVTASWYAEAAEVTDDAPTLAEVEITTHRGSAFVPFSLESEDWTSMEADVLRMVAVAKDDLEGAAFVSGNGTTAPQGVTTALDGGTQEIGPGTAETFAIDDLFKLEGALDARYRRNAKFVANKAWYQAIRSFGTSANAPAGALWETLAGPQPSRLLGYDALESSDMASALPDPDATADNFGLLFGDFAAGYYIVDRVGLTMELIPHLFSDQNLRPTGQRGFFAWWRVGGKVVNAKALVMLSIPTTA